MKQLTIIGVILFTVSMAMSSCMRQKFNHGLPRNNFDRPRPHKRFVKAPQPVIENTYIVKAK